MTQVPEVTFKTRVRDESIGGPNPYRWQDVTSSDLFSGKRVVVFSLPGAFTPTCSTYQLPGYDENYEEFKALGIDEVYCLSVNDSFVMNAWFKQQEIKNVKPIPDGSGEFTYAMGMSVTKANLGFGFRSWRYAMIVDNGEIEQLFEEPGKVGNCPTDPYSLSSPENVLKYLKSMYNENV
jgi:peroxiredoxin